MVVFRQYFRIFLFVFEWMPCGCRALLIMLWFVSNLRRGFVCCISFLKGNPTNLSSAHSTTVGVRDSNVFTKMTKVCTKKQYLFLNCFLMVKKYIAIILTDLDSMKSDHFGENWRTYIFFAGMNHKRDKKSLFSRKTEWKLSFSVDRWPVPMILICH